MKCDFCKKNFPEDELAVVEATPQDEEGNAIGETKSFKVCLNCLVHRIFGKISEENGEND